MYVSSGGGGGSGHPDLTFLPRVNPIYSTIGIHRGGGFQRWL